VSSGSSADDLAAGGGVVLEDAAATALAGAALAALVRGGDAVALIGDLGAGKTTLVAGLVRALGGGAAGSPTFALVHEYPGGRLVVWHVDLYRIEREAELVELGLDELLGDPRGVCLVEWADRFGVMPPDHLRLELAHAGAGGIDHRTLVASGTGPRGRALARDLEAALLASSQCAPP
jgi:tRNA threonylcarbamoyladenosine biosynthesis protein TsaE